MRGIADTGFVVALINVKDRHHRWAAELVHDFEKPLLTCEAVLTEAAYLLRAVGPVIGLLSNGLIEVHFDLGQNYQAVEQLASTYADQTPDLCDLCVVRMSELFPRYLVLTTDRRDFTVYRRNQRELDDPLDEFERDEGEHQRNDETDDHARCPR